MKKFLLLVATAISVIFVGCKPTETPETEPTLFILSKSIAFAQDGGEQELKIESNSKWTLAIDGEASWLKADKMSGEGNATINFTAEENQSEELRETKVKFVAGGKVEKELAVSQAAKEEEPEPEEILLITPGEIEATPTGGEYRTKIACEREWVLLNYDEDWFTVLPASGSTSVDITITCKRNTSDAPRVVGLVFQTVDKKGSQQFVLKQGAFDFSKDITIDPGMSNISYNGDVKGKGLKMWNFAIEDKKFIETNSMDGCTLNFNIASGNGFNDGLPTGEFTVNPSIMDSDFAQGEVVNASYKNPADYYMTTLMKSGTVNIESTGDKTYKIVAELTAADDVVIRLDYTVDLNATEGVTLEDKSFHSDLDGLYTQEIGQVKLINKGDIMGRGVNVWDMTIWGDGATEGPDLTQPNGTGKGTMTDIRFYTPSDVLSPEGEYEVSSSTYRYKANTVEPGSKSAGSAPNGTWIYFYKDGIITTNAPAASGTMTITKNSDGSYALKYDFKDDSPEPSTFNADYDGEIAVVDKMDTGDFDASKTMLTWVGNKYTNENSWILHLETKEYVSSGYKNGEVMEFVLNVASTDQYDMLVDICEWVYDVEGSKISYAIHSGNVTTYENGVASVAKVNGGRITNNFAKDNNYMFRQDLIGITTDAGKTYDMYHYCNLPREDVTVSVMEDVNISDFTTANFTHFGLGSGTQYTNWALMLLSSNGFTYANLDLFIEPKYIYEDGIPSGTYTFTKDNNAVGLWNTNNVRVVSPFGTSGIESGTLTIENLGKVTVEHSNGAVEEYKYNITVDFVLTENNAKLTGTMTGIPATHIDNLTSN